MTKVTETLIITSIMERAKVFLEDAGEFYPFGTILDKDEKLIPVGFYDEREFLPSLEIIDVLQKELIKTIHTEQSIAIAIGIDVWVTKNEVKKNALMIKISNNGIDWTEQYFAYHFQNNSVIWE